MADKIPVYGELDCRTAENIIADAEQIRYDTTKSVKEKIAEIENSGGGGGVDEDTFNNTTGRILQQLCAIADTKLAASTMRQIQLDAEYGDILYLNKISNTEDDYLSIGLASSSGSFILPTSTDYYYTDSIVNFRIPCIIRSFKAGNYYGWEISQVSISSIGRTINTVSIIANKTNIKTLDVAIGAYVNTSNNTWSTNIGDTARYKLVRPSSALIMPKFSIQNISSTSNAQVTSQYTVCEKYDSIYYRATHYFKLKATSTTGKIYLSGDLVLSNGAISVHTYVQELFGFATFAGIDTSSTADNDYALSVVTTQSDILTFRNNTKIGTVKIDSNSKFDTVGDTINVMVVILFKSADI